MGLLKGLTADWICSTCRRQQNRLAKHHSFSTLGRVRASQSRQQRQKLGHANRHASNAANSTTDPTRRNGKLPDFPARTRFAPSPTGYMHIGGLRTALFSYLLAKRTGGQFLLRIEDTDQKRLVEDAEQRLCQDLQWAGLQWDEGPQVGGAYGPYKQSERTNIYQKHASDLLAAGTAYRCFCSPQTTGPGGETAAYVSSGCYQDCSSLSPEEAQGRAESKKEANTVRLKPPVDAHKRVYTDLIYGRIQRLKRSPSASQDSDENFSGGAADTILIKSDGTPTYHFANVVDDHLMQITHVIRGTEWMASTPLHYDLYTAFGWEPPAFAHVGLLVDENQAKLSKRSKTGIVLDVKGMREEQGILPDALCNFLVLQGWSNSSVTDVLEMTDLIRDFDLKFTKGNTIVRMEKLWYLQKQHVARKCEKARAQESVAPIKDIVEAVCREAQAAFPEDFKNRFDAEEGRLATYCTEILLADSKAYKTPKEYVERIRYFFTFDPASVEVSNSCFEGDPELSFEHLARKILESFDFKQDYHQPAINAEDNPSPPSLIDRKSARIHAAINHSIWRVLLNPSWLRVPEDEYDEAARKGLAPPAGQELEYVPFTNKQLDVKAYAEYLQDKTPPHHPGVEEMVRAYKAWNKGMMKYLRERLSYGLPGPGVGVLMALLGYEECCRRLGATPQTRGGW